MKKLFLLTAGIVMSCLLMAEMEPVYYEGFSRCFDEEDENYGYTGGNDNLWGGDIAKAVVIYQDAPEWTFEFCNGANRCLKVGTSAKQGKATTPAIECEGEAVLTFRVAPWEGDSIFYVSIQGGTTSDQTMYHLKKHQWTNVTIRIADIKNAIRITFTSTNNHRFFLDDVCVRPADPDKGVIRTAEGTMLDFGLLGRHYQSSSRTIHVEGVNLKSSGISASLYALGMASYSIRSASVAKEEALKVLMVTIVEKFNKKYDKLAEASIEFEAHLPPFEKADDDTIEKVHTRACEKAGIKNDISSFHAGAETHIYCQHKNSKGETFMPILLGLADVYNMHSAQEKVNCASLLKGYEVIKNTFTEFNK